MGKRSIIRIKKAEIYRLKQANMSVTVYLFIFVILCKERKAYK